MPLIHDKYTPTAREFVEVDKQQKPTGKRVWTSSIGQRNIDLGNGEFTDHAIDAENKSLRFGDCEVRLTPQGLEFWQGGEKKLTSAFHLESKAELSSTWDRPEAVVSGFKTSVLPTNDFADVAQLEYKLSVADQELTVKLCSWGLDRVTFIFEKEALSSGEQQIVWELEETKKANVLKSYHHPDKNKSEKDIGLDFGAHTIKWKYDESDGREVFNKDAGKKTSIAIDRKVFTTSERSIITPDTWNGGAVEIQANNDDAFESGNSSMVLSGEDSDGINFGATTSTPTAADPCLRWDNVTCSGTAGDGCKITFDTTYNNYDACNGGTIAGIEEADPSDWSAGTRPSQRTPNTTATVSFNPDAGWGSGDMDSPELKTIFQELMDSYTYSGTQALAITWDADPTGRHWRQFEDYNTGGTPARLTIVYTPAAGGNEREPDDCRQYHRRTWPGRIRLGERYWHTNAFQYVGDL